MVTPIWQLQRELQYAQAREAYLNDLTRPIKTTVDAQPRSTQVYRSINQKVGAAAVAYRVNVSDAAVAFFGDIAALGLVTLATEPTALPKPSGFKPCLVKAMTSDSTPEPRRAYNGTGRRYIKYSRPTDGAAQSHYQSPISGVGAVPTFAEVQTKFAALATAKAAELGAYGRIYLEMESFSLSGR